VGRSGDTVKSISEKIYGDVGRQKDLRKWNSFLSRGVKVGDKIYYQSPSNPADMSMLTYYEDVSIPAQHYLSRDGDNIRTISKTLLGHKDSWKEVWVTNPDVESKGDIPAGLNLRYWPAEASGTAPILAQQQDPMAGQQPAMDPQNQAGLGQANIPAEPIGQPSIDPLAQGVQPPSADGPETKPTPAADPLALGSTESEPPAPPAPPEDTASGQTGKTANNTPPVSSESASAEADQMMTIGLVVIALIAAGAVVMLVKRNRSRKIDLTQTTQVG
jgi:hypothetical protein